MPAPTDMNVLEAGFRQKVMLALREAMGQGFHFSAIASIRPAQEQAALWRSGRPWWDIEHQIAYLRSQNAPFIAQCIERATASSPAWQTDLLPGESWHQWGEAMDLVWVTEPGHPFDDTSGYSALLAICLRLGLVAKYYRRPEGHAIHLQLRQDQKPDLSWSHIDRRMQEMFPGDPT